MNHMGWWSGYGMLTWSAVSLVVVVLIVVMANKSIKK
jgi:heme exporter protein D